VAGVLVRQHICGCIKEHILGRSHLRATSVAGLFVMQDICGCIKEHILGRSHLHATSVARVLVRQDMCGCIKEHTRSHLHATNVARILAKPAIFIFIKECTLGRSLSPVTIVVRVLNRQELSVNIKEHIHVRASNLLPTSSVERILVK